jgi:LytR cell envelope-related transcriptional attenuator
MSTTRPPAGAPRPSPSSPAKGIAVVAVALVLGVIILWRVPRSGGAGSASGSAKTTTTTTSTTTAAATTTTAVPSMAGVNILVVNAAGVAGAGGKVANLLKAGGLVTLPPGNAVQSGANQSSVYYADGFQAQANRVAQLLGLPAAVGVIDATQIKGGAQGAQVVVMVGKDLSTVTAPTTPGATNTTAKAGATTTTKKPGATTTTKKPAATTTTKKPAATTTTKKP